MDRPLFTVFLLFSFSGRGNGRSDIVGTKLSDRRMDDDPTPSLGALSSFLPGGFGDTSQLGLLLRTSGMNTQKMLFSL